MLRGFGCHAESLSLWGRWRRQRGRFANRPYEEGKRACEGSEIPRLRYASLGMPCCSGNGGWVPAFARTREGEVIRGERCRGSPPSPVFTRAGSNLPPLKGEGICGRSGRSGKGIASATRFFDSAALRMTCWVRGQDGRPRGTPVRGSVQEGGDGSPHPRGHGRGRLFVGNVGGDHPHPPSSLGQALTFPPGRSGSVCYDDEILHSARGRGWVGEARIREDTGGGGYSWGTLEGITPIPRLH